MRRRRIWPWALAAVVVLVVTVAGIAVAAVSFFRYLESTSAAPYTTGAWLAANPHAAGRDTSSLPLLEEHPCPFADEPHGSDVVCATLVVPADRRPGADSTMIMKLAVAIVPATGPGPTRPDPILYLEGGPGGASVAWFDLWAEHGWPSDENRDLILLDQRGTGYSRPSFSCADYLDAPVDEELAALERCHDRWIAWGSDLSTVSTSEHAADVADLREALGIDEWNLFGVSYGSRIALRVLADHPEGVRSVVLDSAYPPEVNALLEEAEVAAEAFDAVFAACAADADCDRVYPDLADTFARAVALLDEQPVHIDGYDATGDDLVIGLFQSLYDPALIPALPQMISSVESDPHVGLELLFDDLGARRTPRATVPTYADSDGTFYSVECREEAATVDAADVLARAGAVSGPAGPALLRQVEQTLEICSWWDSGTADPSERDPVVSEVPTLIVGGELDPVTPLDWGHRAAASLSASTVVAFPGSGHAVFASGGCPILLMERFIADPHEPVDAACASGPIGWELRRRR